MEKENQIIINCLCGNKVKIEDEGKCKSCAIKGKNNPMYGVHRFGNTNPMYGKHHTEETKLKIRLSNEKIRKWDNWNSKKNRTEFITLHRWIRRRKPKSDTCECCQIRPPRDLANISQEYKLDINDFEWLCRSCHMHKDGRKEKLIQRNKNTPRFGMNNPMYGKHYISHRLGKKCSEETKLNMKKAWIIRKLKGVK